MFCSNYIVDWSLFFVVPQMLDEIKVECFQRPWCWALRTGVVKSVAGDLVLIFPFVVVEACRLGF